MPRSLRHLSPLRRAGAALAVTAAAVLTMVAPAAPASAATSCYGGAVPVSWNAFYLPQLGNFTTSSRCSDINFRVKSGSTVTVCVIFMQHTSSCNYETRVGSQWKTIATDVRDGTRFNVRILDTTRTEGFDDALVAF